MSLINDALKRAQSQQQPTPGKGGKPPRVPEMRPAPAPKSSPLPMILVLLLIGCLAGGGWFFWQWFQKKKEGGGPIVEQANRVKTSKTEVVKTPQTKPSTNQDTSTKAPKIEDPLPKVATKSPETKPAPTPRVSTPPPGAIRHSGGETKSTASTSNTRTSRSTGAFPALKLHGIFYNKTKPAVVLNGRTFYIGGTIHGARVVQIDPESVTLEWNGETHLVELAK